jgi:hypothetical protein
MAGDQSRGISGCHCLSDRHAAGVTGKGKAHKRCGQLKHQTIEDFLLSFSFFFNFFSLTDNFGLLPFSLPLSLSLAMVVLLAELVILKLYHKNNCQPMRGLNRVAGRHDKIK